MKLLEQQKQLLSNACEDNWFGVYDIIRQSSDLIDFSNLSCHPMLEEVLMRALAQPNGDMLRLILSRDRGVVARYPALKNLDQVKKLKSDLVEAWRHSKYLQTLTGIHDKIVELVEEDPHRDFSDYLIRAARFPISDPQFKKIIRGCLVRILHHSSLLGLKQTIHSLKGFNQIMYSDAVIILIWNPEYHDRAEYLWEQHVLGHEILRQIIPVAKRLGLPKESIAWIEEHLSAPVPDEDTDCPF